MYFHSDLQKNIFFDLCVTIAPVGLQIYIYIYFVACWVYHATKNFHALFGCSDFIAFAHHSYNPQLQLPNYCLWQYYKYFFFIYSLDTTDIGGGYSKTTAPVLRSLMNEFVQVDALIK